MAMAEPDAELQIRRGSLPEYCCCTTSRSSSCCDSRRNPSWLFQALFSSTTWPVVQIILISLLLIHWTPTTTTNASYVVGGELGVFDWDDEIPRIENSTQSPNAPKCDRTFISSPDGPRNGTFVSPTFANLEGHSRQCLYTFVAGPGERVHIAFHVFNLRGTPPECIHEYMDLYTEVPDSEHVELINSPFGGRYCGQIPPRRRISLFRTVVIGFYTDKNYTSDELFQGTFQFIKDDQYQVGTPVPRTTCSFVINGTVKRQGEIITPTYPGVYPKDLSCSYKLVGQKGQRIRLEFRDFDLFFGGAHCPFDAVNVYDGHDQESPLIGTYCGQQRNLVLYSTDHLLFITFATLKRTADSQNRGFAGIYEFSEGFVKLDFISKNEGEHVRGTECDQTIFSRKGSTGVVYSPNYPFPYLPGITCRYYILGLQDVQHFERVRIEFEKFDIPTPDGTCTDGFVKLYAKGQETNYEKFDADLCGKDLPAGLWSEGPRLVLVFSSGQTQGSGFKAKYSFSTEYLIPGTPAPNGACHFTYLSASKKRGDFNSPRHPSNYPSNMTCTYNFMALPNEQVVVIFDQFKVRANRTNMTHGYYCQEDWVEIYNMYGDGLEKLHGRYCGSAAPGPIESNRGATGMRIVLHTDEDGVYSGFKARYFFEPTKPYYEECGRNMTGSRSGIVTSPNWPGQYAGPDRNWGTQTCHWFIGVRPGYHVLLNFQYFAVEGSLHDRGCPAATVRVWNGGDTPPMELCGENLSEDMLQQKSEGNTMRITFSTADKAVGAKGFRAVWTEVKQTSICHEFLCSVSAFCISEQLRCDGILNCGFGDTSDEDDCVFETPISVPMLAGILGSVGSVLCIVLCVTCHRKRRRRRRRPLGHSQRGPSHLDPALLAPRTPPVHSCESLGERLASIDSV